MATHSKIDELKTDADAIVSLIEEIKHSLGDEDKTVELLSKLKELSTSFAATTLMFGKGDNNGLNIGDAERLFSLVSECANIPVSELILLRKKRIREHVLARQVHMAMIHVIHDKSLYLSGKIYYDKDHATVLHGIKTVNALLETSKTFRKSYAPIINYGLEVNRKRMMKKFVLDKFLQEQ